MSITAINLSCMIMNATTQSIVLPFSGITLPNRLVKAATSERLADPWTNFPNEELCTAYAAWSKGGIGVIHTGNVHIDRRYMESARNVAAEISDLNDTKAMQKWKRWAAACKANGKTVAIVQLSHGGRQAPRSVGRTTIAPSAVPLKIEGTELLPYPFAAPKEATLEEIKDVIERFAVAAKVAQAAGFDGVQVHSAHGYLLSTFLSPNVNHRTDCYGGNPENRRRLLCEICERIRQELPKEFILSVKLNSSDFQKGGLTEEESIGVTLMLMEVGVDYVEFSGGTYESAAMVAADSEQVDELLMKNNSLSAAGLKESTRKREAFFIEFIDKVRTAIQKTKHSKKIVLMLSGGWRSTKAMHSNLLEGRLDLIGLGRPLCVEPNFPNRILAWKPSDIEDVTALSYQVRVSIPFLPLFIHKKLSAMVDPVVQTIWHLSQVQRISRNLSVDFNLPILPILLEAVFENYIDFQKHKTMLQGISFLFLASLIGLIGIVLTQKL